MGQCVFCGKQTNNEYNYYVAGNVNSAREKISVFACTKCLKQKGVIILSIISALFLITLIGQISEMATGSQPIEAGPLTAAVVLTLALLFWIFYRMREIKADKLLPEASAAKKLIKKAKKVNPAKFYFTPAENALIPAKDLEQINTLSSKGETNTTQDKKFVSLKEMPIINPILRKTAENQKHKQFPLFTGSGVCDVCNASLSGRTAYIVPNNVFYNSQKYREQQRNSGIAAFVGIPIDDAYFSRMQAQDKSAGSAVCENCIHLFN